jgi:hypothetical protein
MASFLRVCFCIPFLCLIGCQRLPERPEGMPELVPCTIVVTFGGEKMEGVAVLLQPKNKEASNWPGGGKTDVEGKAVIKTAAYYEGAVPGEYTISFQKSRPEEMGPGVPLIPAKYFPTQSKETITVSKSQAEYVFTLEALGANAKK